MKGGGLANMMRGLGGMGGGGGFPGAGGPPRL
jgi:signal recognition particle subunit SRP54